MSIRTSISVEGLTHGSQPFPIASRKGKVVTTSGIHGLNPSNGRLEADPEKQIEQLFANLAAVVAAAGGTPGDITLVLVSLTDKSHREIFNQQWVKMFPDPQNRPARNTQVRELDGGSFCSVLATAVLD